MALRESKKKFNPSIEAGLKAAIYYSRKLSREVNAMHIAIRPITASSKGNGIIEFKDMLCKYDKQFDGFALSIVIPINGMTNNQTQVINDVYYTLKNDSEIEDVFGVYLNDKYSMMLIVDKKNFRKYNEVDGFETSAIDWFVSNPSESDIFLECVKFNGAFNHSYFITGYYEDLTIESFQTTKCWSACSSYKYYGIAIVPVIRTINNESKIINACQLRLVTGPRETNMNKFAKKILLHDDLCEIDSSKFPEESIFMREISSIDSISIGKDEE